MDFVTDWLSHLLTALDSALGDEQKRAAFHGCSLACTEPWASKAVEVRQRAVPGAGTAALLAAFCAVLPGGGPDVQVDGSHIAWTFAPPQCPCPVGQATRNPAVCSCGREHVRGMLEALLGQPVDVTLKQSLLRGDDCCSYAVEIRQD